MNDKKHLTEAVCIHPVIYDYSDSEISETDRTSENNPAGRKQARNIYNQYSRSDEQQKGQKMTQSKPLIRPRSIVHTALPIKINSSHCTSNQDLISHDPDIVSINMINIPSQITANYTKVSENYDSILLQWYCQGIHAKKITIINKFYFPSEGIESWT